MQLDINPDVPKEGETKAMPPLQHLPDTICPADRRKVDLIKLQELWGFPKEEDRGENVDSSESLRHIVVRI